MTRKITIVSAAVGLAAGAVLLAVLIRRPPAPTRPDGFQDVGPVAHAFGRPAGSGQLAASTAMPRKRPADALEAELQYRQSRGQIPTGSVRVATPDELDAGAENGHVVPVTVWIAGTDGVVGLHGDASFTNGPDGFTVRSLTLEPLPLAVPTWAEAARLVAKHKPGAAPPRRLEAPFDGVFHMAAGQEHYAVDAMTGRVEQE